MTEQRQTRPKVVALTLACFAAINVQSHAFSFSPVIVDGRSGIPSNLSYFRGAKIPPFAALPKRMTNLKVSQESDENDTEKVDDIPILETEIVDGLAGLSIDNKTPNLVQNMGKRLKQIVSSAQLRQPHAFLVALSIFLLPLFLLSPNDAAWAVQSGGRMGGSFGGSSRQSSGRSYSSPSSSYGGSYSRGYSRGYSNGYYSRPNVVVSPGVSPYYSPFYSPFSWGPSVYSRPGVVVSTGPSLFGGFMVFFVGFLLLATLAMNNIGNNVGNAMNNFASGNSAVVGALGPGVSVAEISVALQVPDRDSPDSILSALNRLARTARTDSRVGLQNLTSQVALELLRRKQSIVAASASGNHYNDESKAQRDFNNLSIQERGKFERETVSKYGGVDYSPSTNPISSSQYSPKATMAVVTILLLIEGNSTSNQLSSSRINSIRDVEKALSQIAADSKVDNCLRGAEILWTPEERDDTLTMRDVFADYSNLRNV